MDSNIPSCGHGTTIVQKCLSEVFRIARFCTNFLKNFLGGDPQTPHLPGISKGMFLINTCTVKNTPMVCFLLFFFPQNYPPPLSCWKGIKKKPGPPFLKSWIRHWNIFKTNLNELINKHIPHKKLSSKPKTPWVTNKTKSLMKRRDRLYKTRGPGALYRAQEYHCNLALFFFTWKVHKLMKIKHFASLKYLRENKWKWLPPIHDLKRCQKLDVRIEPKVKQHFFPMPKCF